MKQGQTEPYVPVTGSGRLQSVISFKTEGGLRLALTYFSGFQPFGMEPFVLVDSVSDFSSTCGLSSA